MSTLICSQAKCSTISMAILIFEAHEVISFIFIILNLLSLGFYSYLDIYKQNCLQSAILGDSDFTPPPIPFPVILPRFSLAKNP